LKQQVKPDDVRQELFQKGQHAGLAIPSTHNPRQK